MRRRDLVALGAMLFVGGLAVRAMGQVPTDVAPFTDAQLDQMLAPIALYPDALLAQVLMASTYPVEVAAAARWASANQDLRGDQAAAAVKDMGWDPSVASLVAFPGLLQTMSRQLRWVQNIGDAMIGQQSEVAGSIQRLRTQALAAGTLRSTPQQKIVRQPPSAGAPAGTSPAIVIEPVDEQVVHLPSYDPYTVYGSWPYPDDPPVQIGRWRVNPAAGALDFGAGHPVGGAFFGGWGWGGGWGGGWGWRGWQSWAGAHSYTTMNVDRAAAISRGLDRGIYADGRWAHDAAHRGGAPYRTTADRDRYGHRNPGSADREAFRGHADGDRDGRGGDRNHGLSGVNHGRDVNREANRGHDHNSGGKHAGSADRSHADRDKDHHDAAHHSGGHHGGGHHGGGHHSGGHGGRR